LRGLEVRLRRSELGLRLAGRRALVNAIELHENVAQSDDIALTHVDLRDTRLDAARDVDVDAFDNPATTGGPVLGGTEVPNAQHEGDEQPNGEDTDEDQSALHDALLATSRPIAWSTRTCAMRWSIRRASVQTTIARATSPSVTR
jgi:hypothetical protein